MLTKQIETECSQFLNEVGNILLCKYLPSKYGDASKLKLRHRKPSRLDPIFESIGNIPNLLGRSITLSPISSVSTNPPDGYSLYAVYPVNGYQYLYHPSSTHDDLENTIQKLSGYLAPVEINENLGEIVRLNYKSENLQEGCIVSDEITFYGIPFCYLIRITI